MNRNVMGVVLLLAGCSTPYAGPHCEALVPGASVADLPAGETRPAPSNTFQWSDPLIAGTTEMRCCAGNVSDARPSETECASVDCEALRARITLSALGERYANETCGPRAGASTCTVAIEDAKVVGVYAMCFD